MVGTMTRTKGLSANGNVEEVDPLHDRQDGGAPAAPRRARANSRDVARAAGVSVNTVSLVVRRSPLVAPPTRERVQAVIDRMGYKPHAAAAALRSTRSHTLGFLVFEVREAVHDVFRHQLLSAVTTRAQAADHYLLIDTFVEAARSAALLDSGRIDGAVIDWLVPDAVLAALVARGAPVVVAGRAGTGTVSWVRADEDGGAASAGRHLLALGHRRLAVLAAGEAEGNAVVSARLSGFARALDEAGLVLAPDAVVHGDWTFEAGLALGGVLLDRRPRPTAIFVLNELMAMGLVRAAGERGLDIPGDLTIVTVEDSPWVEYVTPRLSAVHVPMYDVGAQATAVLLRLLDDPATPPARITLPTRLVVRASSGPPPP